MSKRRVVVTGLGTINPLGNNVEDTWKNLVNGVSGIDSITSFDTSNLPVTFAGEVKTLMQMNIWVSNMHENLIDQVTYLYMQQRKL